MSKQAIIVINSCCCCPMRVCPLLHVEWAYMVSTGNSDLLFLSCLHFSELQVDSLLPLLLPWQTSATHPQYHVSTKAGSETRRKHYRHPIHITRDVVRNSYGSLPSYILRRDPDRLEPLRIPPDPQLWHRRTVGGPLAVGPRAEKRLGL